jgi:peptidoglycan/LPS O-acetylase OafA/YrhL
MAESCPVGAHDAPVRRDESSRSSTHARLATIDSFRALSIGAVMAFHYLYRWQDITHYEWTYSGVFALGRYGVEVFFVISGAVIAMTLVKSGDVWDFAFKRFARLWPTLFVISTCAFILLQFGPKGFSTDIYGYLSSLFFIFNELHLKPVDNAYWSLAIEVKFYLYSAVSWLFLRNKFWMGLCGLAVVASVLNFLNPNWLSYALLGRFWPYFLFGIAIWLGLFERRRVPSLCLGAIATVMFIFANPGIAPSAYIVVNVFAMVLLLWKFPNISIPILPSVGRASYGLYLMHQNLGIMLILALSGPDFVRIGVVSTFMVVAALLFYRGVELPLQRCLLHAWGSFRDRRIPSAQPYQKA